MTPVRPALRTATMQSTALDLLSELFLNIHSHTHHVVDPSIYRDDTRDPNTRALKGRWSYKSGVYIIITLKP